MRLIAIPILAAVATIMLVSCQGRTTIDVTPGANPPVEVVIPETDDPDQTQKRLEAEVRQAGIASSPSKNDSTDTIKIGVNDTTTRKNPLIQYNTKNK